jgi:hypothetical protein
MFNILPTILAALLSLTAATPNPATPTTTPDPPITARELWSAFVENPIKAGYTYTIGAAVIATGTVYSFEILPEKEKTFYIIILHTKYPEQNIKARFDGDKLGFITTLKTAHQTKVACKLAGWREYELSLDNCDEFKEAK